MNKEELEKEAEEKYHNHKIMDFQGFYNHHYYYLGYVESAEPREKQISELEMAVGTLRTFSNEQATCIERLKAQIEKMKSALIDIKSNTDDVNIEWQIKYLFDELEIKEK